MNEQNQNKDLKYNAQEKKQTKTKPPQNPQTKTRFSSPIQIIKVKPWLQVPLLNLKIITKYFRRKF